MSKLWFNEEMQEFDLVFEFPPEKVQRSFFPPSWRGKLLWRYTIEYVDHGENVERVLSTGYFKLNPDTLTKLDLRTAYKDYQVKWVRFTVFNAENPQRRAWFSPIKGKYFNVNFRKNFFSKFSNIRFQK